MEAYLNVSGNNSEYFHYNLAQIMIFEHEGAAVEVEFFIVIPLCNSKILFTLWFIILFTHSID